MVATTIPALLRERALLQPDDPAYTFMDYDQDWAGVALSLTWPQLYRRVLNVARELSRCASPGDRAIIVAPQGLEYIVAFLGALQAGVIAVPLAVPMGGATDERVDSVLHDAMPTAILTTSAVVDALGPTLAQQGDPSPAVIEVDRLDLDTSVRFDAGEGGRRNDHESTAYLQYTSGSTRRPAGVMVSYHNLLTNLQQITSDFLADYGGVAPPDMTFVSWLPFFHDLGLIIGVCSPVILGTPAVLTSPVSFLQRPARWMQLAASNSRVFTSAPNFAFDVAARKTSDEDMAGLDLGGVLLIQSGGERVQPATIKRFAARFTRFNLRESVILPSYGLAEATLYVARRIPGQPPEVVHFDPEQLSQGQARRCDGERGTPLVSYGAPHSPQSPMVRIVDPQTRTETPAGTIGEIWVRGENVSAGYWQKPEETQLTFGATIVSPSAGTPDGPWLRTGDRGFVFEGELFIVGRIKDLLIVYGRNHSPEDIEATVQEITRGRVAAIAVPVDGNEQLAVIAEVKKPDAGGGLADLEREITAAVSQSHGLALADLVLVAPGSIPITTSGKIRRSACVEMQQGNQFARVRG